jgi:small subunit ribosomal protein S17
MKIFTGRVVAKKLPKTAAVVTERVFAHPLYQKRVKRMKKYQVHDTEDKAQVGDWVKFTATKPVSKLKRWQIIEIVKESKK